MRPLWYLAALVPLTSPAFPQVLSNGSLNGGYYARHIEFTTDSGNNVTDARSIIGTIAFDGSGAYSFQGLQVIGTGASATYTASGTYSVSPGGFVTLTNPQKNTLSINARYGVEAVVGAGTETSGNTFDLFVAIPAPGTTESNTALQGNWTATNFELTGASTAQVRTAMISMALDGAGNASSLTLSGHAANFNSGTQISQTITGGIYSLGSNGSGSILFPLPAGSSGAGAMLSATQRSLYVSRSGNIILAGTPGAHDLFVGVRNSPGAVALTTGQRFWGAAIRVDSAGSSDNDTGSFTTIASDSSFIASRRLHETGSPAFNWTVASVYTLATDGTGSTGSAKLAVEQANNFVSAHTGSPLDPTGYEIAVGVAIPTVSGSGVFVNPQGIVNSASNAPAGDAVSPGEFITIYGSGLAAASAQAASLPFPATLGGVSVTVNGIPAPLYLVSPGQINCIVPYEVTGQTARIVVNNGGPSNPVTVPLAPTSPGVFTTDLSGTRDGAITHSDGVTLVNASNPAQKGETVVMYMSGLGGLTNPVNDGFGATGANNAPTPLQVYVAGIPTPTIAYQGLTVDAGLYQINFLIPPGLTVSGELPVAVQTPDAFNDTATVAVR